MKYKVLNNDSYLGDAVPVYFDSVEEAEKHRELIIERLIESFREEAIRDFREEYECERDVAIEEVSDEWIIDNTLRQQVKEAIEIVKIEEIEV